ncbi:MAG: hypothetical protein F6K16_10120 [Symploca sp. SIO2B6]|nr:hypothetical protein [Symploca sp. SIO2B6]
MNNEHKKVMNENTLQALSWALKASQGRFSLILARCNYASLRRQMVQQLQSQLLEGASLVLTEITLHKSVKKLFATLKNQLGQKQPQALMVFGLESLSNLEQVLTAANQVREEFGKHFHFPLVLWVTDEVMRRLIRLAPDFYSWATSVEFAITTDDLIKFIEQTADAVVAKVLDAGAGIFLDNTALNLEIGSPLRTELESARQELITRGARLNRKQEASLEFIIGRELDNLQQDARQHYERSLALWQQQRGWGEGGMGRGGEEEDNGEFWIQNSSFDSKSLEIIGCVLYSLGLWWRTYAERHRAEYEYSYQRSKDYWQQCIEVFKQANRLDLVAKFINALGGTLQRLQMWQELEIVAQEALVLHKIYSDSFRQARAYGFLAEVALHKSANHEAKQYSLKAISILEITCPVPINPVSSERSSDLERMCSYHKSWYLFSLARAQDGLGKNTDSIENLEAALAQAKPQHEPSLYIRILQKLRDCYFQKSEYLRAFHFKQQQRSIEQQFNFRAFIGAGCLQPKQQVTNPLLPHSEQQEIVAQEIAASGREQDVNNLIERLGRSDHKLTIIHGPSGVGKSSILQAGLIPTLKHKSIGTRDVLPILQRVYTYWVEELGQRLAASVDAMRLNRCCQPIFKVWEAHYKRREINAGEKETEVILEQLKANAEQNLLTVLIFDQFEEFVFIYKEPSSRSYFYNFLRLCLDIPYVKVILSLRQDYLYYLLECNNRIVNFDVINNNILDKDILYALDNFLPEAASSVIRSLTEPIHFDLEPALIDELVKDLSAEIGEVRPIELQVIGSQLQTDKISTLAEYQKYGSKAKLVERYLSEVVQDCGPENKETAQLVLYLLTDENNTRPLKTRKDLEKEITTLAASSEQLDLVLKIFQASGLVFLLPELPAERYQLVHDYLVIFIRQQQTSEQLQELAKVREKQRLTEEQLRQALKEKEQALREKELALYKEQQEHQRAEIAETEALNSLSQARLLSNNQLGALLASVKAGKNLLELETEAPTEVKLRTINILRQALSSVQERNRLRGHEAAIFGVSFSPDGKILASASEDGTLKLWQLDGTQLATCRSHDDLVFSVSFSPNSEIFASASADKTVKIWKRDGTLLKTLKGHQDQVFNISFSPNGQQLASASKDGTIKIWNLGSTSHKTLKQLGAAMHSVSFSPDGNLIASASEDNTIKLWDREHTWPRIFNGHHAGVLSVCFSPDGQLLASASKDGTVKLWNLDGQELETLQKHGFWIYRVSFSPDGQMLVLTGGDGTVRICQLDGSPLQSFQGHSGEVFGVSFSPDGKLLASAGEDKTIRLWSLDGIGVYTYQGHSDRVISFSFSQGGQLLASGSEDKTVKLWRLDGTLLKTFQGHSAGLRSVSFSPDGQILASASSDGVVKLWHVEGALLNTLLCHSLSVRSLSFSADGKILASASNDRTVKLWHLDGTLVKTLHGHLGKILSVTFSPDSQTIASAGEDKTINIWSIDGTLLNTLTGHSTRIVSICFSSDGQMLASASADRSVKLWSRYGNLLATLQGHEAGVKGVTFSPDDQIIASVSADRSVKLWSRDGNLLKTLKGHLASVCNLSFSADSQIIISVDENSVIKLWSLEGKEIQTSQAPLNKNRRRRDFITDSEIATAVNGDTISELKSLLAEGCNWLCDYLHTNPNLSQSDRSLCIQLGNCI